jgi:transposase
MIPTEQSSDLRDYYSKHTKSDRLDSRLLARIPLLHPDGLRQAEGLGPAESMRRASKLRSSLVKRRATIIARLDCYLELLGPAWHACFRADLVQNTPLQLLAAGYGDPHTLRRLGRARLSKFIWRYSHGHHGEDQAIPLLEAAAETLRLWDDSEINFGELADDIAVEARLALQLSREIEELERRIEVLLHEQDPIGIMVSVPGVATVNGAQILARLGDPARFSSLAGARSFSGLVPSLKASGVNGYHGGPTKSGDAPLRESLFIAANWARRIDPTLAHRYHRLMVQEGKHHNSALCHIAATLLTRIVACWRTGEPYLIRDFDGTVLTPQQGRRVCETRYHVASEIRAQRRTRQHEAGTGRRRKESPGAPSIGPSPLEATSVRT